MTDEEIEAILKRDFGDPEEVKKAATFHGKTPEEIIAEAKAKLMSSEQRRDVIANAMNNPKAATEAVVAAPVVNSVRPEVVPAFDPQAWAKALPSSDRRDIIQKAMTTESVVGKEPLPKTTSELNVSIQGEDTTATPDDTYTENDILPFRTNDRTNQVEFDVNSGLVGDVIEGATLPGRVASGEFNDMYTADPNNDGILTEEEGGLKRAQWNKFLGESLNAAGLPTLGTLPGAALPNTLHAGLRLPPAVKQKMTAIRAGTPPSVFDVSTVDVHAPKNLKSLEKPTDLYKAYYVDDKQVLGDLAERAGVPNLGRVTNMIDQDTQNTALMRVNEALRSGKLKTAYGQYDVKTPPEMIYAKYKQLDPVAQQDADQYMKLKDYTDDLNLMVKKGINTAKAQAELLKVQQSIAQIEGRTPVVKDFANEYRTATDAVRQFLASGPNAVFSAKALQGLNLERPNYVPIDITGVNPSDPLLARISDANNALERQGMQDWFTKARDLKSINGIDNRVNSFEILLDYSRNALQHKMENDTRGEYIRELLQSTNGKETIRPLKKDEIGKYADRTVQVYENGKKVSYLSSKLQRDLLQFDPYVAKFPALYGLKRLFEIGTTGPLSITFAPTTMIRDALTGSVLREKGLPAPGLIGTLAAVPQQVIPKFYRGASEALKTTLKDVPFMDPVAKAQLADNLANRYARSMYALSNEVGGIDASLMKSNIEAGRGVMREVGRTLEELGNKIPGSQNPIMRALGHSPAVLARGWDTIFGAISDAPRFSVFKKQVEQGVNPSEAAVAARRIAGDTSRGGKPYLASGERIKADVQNKSATAPAKFAGWSAAFAREAIPYYNPSVQGMRRLATRFVADPIRTNLNAWKYVGLPALAAYGWNEMMGPEYNDYAQQMRSERDIAMNIYVAIPGLPPERGLEIPIGHEMTPWNAPWSTALYNMGRGDEDVMKGLMHSGAQVLKNASMIGYPQVGAMALNASGYTAPQSLLTPMDDTYQMREDNVGFLPENVERMARTTFGSISDIALLSAAAGYEAGPEAFFDELGWQIGKRTPLVKNVIGAKTAQTAFTPKSEEYYNKINALDTFLDAWEQSYGDKAEVIRETPPAKWDEEVMGRKEPENSDLRVKLGPNLTPMPTNPVFKHFGDMIKSTIGTNTEGMTALKDRSTLLNKQIKLLRGYTAGRRQDFKDHEKLIPTDAVEQYDAALKELKSKQKGMKKREYEKQLKGLNNSLGQKARARQLYDDLKIDLTKRSDVNRLVNYLEMERWKMVNEQVTLIKQLEDRMTAELQKAKILPAGVSFQIEKHLSPTVPKEFVVQ